MRKIIIKSVMLLSLPSILVVMLGCGSDSPNGPSGATVEGRLTLPTEANGKEYWVLIDNDINGDNGYLRAVSGNCGSGTSVNYSFSDVPAGTYYVYAGVRIVSSSDSAPENGDYVGIYGGTLSNAPSQPNAVVPSSGTVTFNITLGIMAGGPKLGQW